MKKLKPAQQVFVMEALTPGVTPKQAAINAGYSEKGANVTAHNLLGNQKVQNALQEKIQELYPNIQQQLASKLKEILDMDLKHHPDQDGITPGDALKAIQTYVKIFGYEAPKKTAHLSAKLTGKLPGSE